MSIRIRRSIPATNILHNAEVIHAETPPETPGDGSRALQTIRPTQNAKAFADGLQEQRQEFQSRGIQMNMEGLIEAEFMIRRNILDKMLDPRHEIDKECGYPQDITPTMYHLMFERDPISRRVVEIFPKESWAQVPELFESHEETETLFEQGWAALVKKMNLWHMLQRIDILSGIGRFGVILLGIDDGKDMSQPVDGINDRGEKVGRSKPGKKQRELIFMRVFDETVVRVNMREANTNNPRFGKPTMYTLTFKDLDITELAGSGIATVGDVTKRVHWSRVIHIADNREMSEIYGCPRMKPVFNRLMDARKITGGSGEMFWKGAFPGLSFELSPGVGDAQLDLASLKDQIARYSGGLQRWIALTGMTTKSLAPQVSDPTHHIEAQILAICISLGIPRRIFTGSEEGRLASNQDAKTWNARVMKRNEEYVSPMLIRPVVDRLITLEVLPEPEGEYEIYWPDLNTTTDLEKAQIALAKTQALQAYCMGGVDALIQPEDYLAVIMEIDDDQVADMLKASQEAAHIEAAADQEDIAASQKAAKQQQKQDKALGDPKAAGKKQPGGGAPGPMPSVPPKPAGTIRAKFKAQGPNAKSGGVGISAKATMAAAKAATDQSERP